MPIVFFDVDGTLASSNIVSCYMDIQRHRLSRNIYLPWMFLFLARLPSYWLMDKLGRERFNRNFFQVYAGMPVSHVESWEKTAARHFWQRHLFHEAVQEINLHREQGHLTVLLSGGIEPTLRPLAQLLSADRLLCPRLQRRGQRYLARLSSGPMGGQRKAETVRQLGAENNIDLARCYAYSDSYSDRPFLESVGNPTAVNPDWPLSRLAKARGWPILHWKTPYLPRP